MSLSSSELAYEEKYLEKTENLIRKKISELGIELYDREEKVIEFKKFIWESKKDLDPAEMRTLMTSSDEEIERMMKKSIYFQKLYKIQNSPYFGSIIFEENNLKPETVYIGITHLEEKLNYYIHDWRSPICSLFYDYETGPCEYIAPGGVIKGNLTRKRQYQIKDGKLDNVFESDTYINDDLLQSVLKEESSEKMKNIVNTIQEEQNKIIRNTNDKTLVVQGIAGSGKTSVALHRVAFLLYKIENLSSNNILIFSPNKVFTEYISNVLPELGEDNTGETTYHDFLRMTLPNHKIESFTDFISRYYQTKSTDFDLTKYKQSDEIINSIDKYISYLTRNTRFIDDFSGKGKDSRYFYTKDELNEMLTNRYSKFPLFERINHIAIKISENNFDGKDYKASSIKKSLYNILNIKEDYLKIYSYFFKSKFSKINKEIRINSKYLNYEDACLIVYIKCLLLGFDYNVNIKEIVIDEAQDYTKLQLLIIKKIFKKSGFTILGDINQTINPYYKYENLENITQIFESSKYLELIKTYRSSEEIINYTNKILGLNHISAVRRKNNHPVIKKKEDNLKDNLLNDIEKLQLSSKSIAIITKNDEEAELIYELLSKDTNISIINNEIKKFNRDLIVIPSYMAKGLEFDSVIVYTKHTNKYTYDERYLFYVACTRAQHQLIVYNQED